MLPYGWDGATYRPLKVDDEGRMIGVMKGQADVKWGLRGWWKFVASEGTTIKDYSGYGNNGSAFSGVAGEAKYEDGVIGQALLFDGADDYVDCGNDSSIRPGEADFSVEYWIYRTEADVIHQLLSAGVAPTRWLTSIQVNNKVTFYIQAGGSSAIGGSTDTVDINTWIHVVITFDRDGDAQIYLNGAVNGDPVDIATIGDLDTAQHVFIGRSAGGEYYKGLIDEVRYYGRVLSADEVAWRYANTNPAVGKPTRMIAVDNEGRMEVNLKDLPYKSQVLEQKIVTSAGGASVSITTSTVPEGKVWVITKAIAYTDTAALDSIDIGIYDGVDNYIIAACREVDSCIKIETNNDMILKAGDKISAGFGGLPANWVVGIVINGYELDAS
jgi:hypothetical protein